MCPAPGAGRGIRSGNRTGQQAQCLQQGRSGRPLRERKETMRLSISLGALVAVTTLLVAVLTTAQPKSPAEIVEERRRLEEHPGECKDRKLGGGCRKRGDHLEERRQNSFPLPGGLTDRQVKGKAGNLAEVARVRGHRQEDGNRGGPSAEHSSRRQRGGFPGHR